MSEIDFDVAGTGPDGGLPWIVCLGLSIAARLARAMGGQIDARSVPGQGCEFALVLPRHDK